MATPPRESADRKRDDFIAVEMKSDHSYPSSAGWLPNGSHDTIPEEFRNSDNHVLLKKGEQGWCVVQSHDKRWSQCQFERDGTYYNFAVESEFLLFGCRYGDRKAVDAYQPPSVKPEVPRFGQGSPLARYIRTFWTIVRDRQLALINLGMPQWYVDKCFGDNFHTNVDSIINAFCPEAEAILRDPNPSTLAGRLLRGLTAVTKHTPQGLMCYIRLYTRLTSDNAIKDPAVYAGITVRPAQRNEEHKKATESSNSWHYSVASKYPKKRLFMGEMLKINHLDVSLSPMAEQTLVSVFGSYSPSVAHFDDAPSTKDIWVAAAKQSKFLTEARNDAMDATGWPDFDWIGCNVASPLFMGTHQSGRGWIRRSVPATPFTPRLHRYSTGLALPDLTKNPKGYMLITVAHGLNLTVPKVAVETCPLRPGQLTNLVFDVTADRSRHPQPWIGVPDVGLYEHFNMASTFAVYLEVYDDGKKEWTKCQIFRRNFGATVGEKHYPWGYMKAMAYLQHLEGVQYNTTNEHFPRSAYFVRSMEYMQYNHLRQTIGWVQMNYPLTRRDLPHRMTYAENRDVMFDKYPWTIIDPQEKPNHKWFHPPAQDSRKFHSHGRRLKCDLCVWTSSVTRTNDLKCEGGPGGCVSCREQFNRPCTYTNLDVLKGLIGDGDSPRLFYNMVAKVNVGTPENKKWRFLDARTKLIGEPMGGQALLQWLAAAAPSTEEEEQKTAPVLEGDKGELDNASIVWDLDTIDN